MKNKSITAQVILLIGLCSCQSNVEQVHDENVKPQLRSINEQVPEKTKSICSQSFYFPTFSEFLNSIPENRITSGRMNRDETLEYFTEFKDDHFGFYQVLGENVNEVLTIAKVVVGFKQLPWKFEDPTQEIYCIAQFSNEFKMDNLPVYIGIDIAKIEKPCILYQTDSIMIVNRGKYLCTLMINQDKVVKAFYLPFENVKHKFNTTMSDSILSLASKYW